MNCPQSQSLRAKKFNPPVDAFVLAHNKQKSVQGSHPRPSLDHVDIERGHSAASIISTQTIAWEVTFLEKAVVRFTNQQHLHPRKKWICHEPTAHNQAHQILEALAQHMAFVSSFWKIAQMVWTDQVRAMLFKAILLDVCFGWLRRKHTLNPCCPLNWVLASKMFEKWTYIQLLFDRSNSKTTGLQWLTLLSRMPIWAGWPI